MSGWDSAKNMNEALPHDRCELVTSQRFHHQFNDGTLGIPVAMVG